MTQAKKPATKRTATKKVVDTASGAVKLPGIDNCIEDNRNLQKTVDKKDSIIYNIIAQQAIINATK
jgi:hypothetical protein